MTYKSFIGHTSSRVHQTWTRKCSKICMSLDFLSPSFICIWMEVNGMNSVLWTPSVWVQQISQRKSKCVWVTKWLNEWVMNACTFLYSIGSLENCASTFLQNCKNCRPYLYIQITAVYSWNYQKQKNTKNNTTNYRAVIKPGSRSSVLDKTEGTFSTTHWTFENTQKQT